MMHIEDVKLNIEPELPARRDYRIGVVGSGFIVRDQQLVAYREMDVVPWGIASLHREHAEAVAKLRGIPHCYDSWQELLADEAIEILDIAIPPNFQLDVVREAVRHKNIRGILCQKPLAMNLTEAKQIEALCRDAGVTLAVNSNMRYDPSIRALKSLLDRDLLGEPVLANIDMHCIPHWQKYMRTLDRLEILNMGIHHVDSFRYLFGDPERITALTRTDPRMDFAHTDGISQYTFQYKGGLMATSMDDVWAWPGEGCEQDCSLRWRVIGTDGLAEGAIFWYEKTPVPSTIRFTSKRLPCGWYAPDLKRAWFPSAFKGTMAQLLRAVENNTEPEISGRDNLRTMAAIDACYLSIAQRRTVDFAAYLTENGLV